MHAFLIAAVVLQVKVGASVTTSPADSTKKNVNVGITIGSSSSSRSKKPPKRIPVTAEHLKTAFKTPAARMTRERARAARMSQDSALMSYDATAYLRISAGLGFSKIGR